MSTDGKIHKPRKRKRRKRINYNYSLCDRAHKRCLGASLGAYGPHSDYYIKIVNESCDKNRDECESRERERQTPNPAPRDYNGCINRCMGSPLHGRPDMDKVKLCMADCEHKYRNRHNRCPAKEPKAGVSDSEGRSWTADLPLGEGRYHGGYDCYRSGHYQCCYDCEGNVVNTGRYQGTYDYDEFDEDVLIDWGHAREDVWPHSFGPNNYFDDQTTIYK